jgi:signal transduction histidine kinase/CheY-like chemotaxis protein
MAYVYGAAVAALAVLLQWAVRPWLGNQSPFLFVVPALMFVAASFGRGPSLTLIAAGALQAVLLHQSAGDVSRYHLEIVLAVYLALGAVIVVYVGQVRLQTLRGDLAEKRLALAQDQTGVGLFELDFQANQAFVSPSLCQLLEQPVMPGAIPLDLWLNLLHPNHVEDSRRVLQEKVARGELHYEREQCIELKNGQQRWLLSRVRIDVTPDNALARARGVAVDITERKQLDARLQDAQAELRQQVTDLQRLHALSQQLVAGSDQLELPLQALLELVVDFHGTSHGLLSLNYPGNRQHSVVAHTGLDQSALGVAMLRSVGQTAVDAQGVTDGQGAGDWLAAGDWQPADNQQVLSAHRTLAQQLGFPAVYSTPLLSAGGELLGMISVLYRELHQPSEREIRLSEVCATTAAAVIERERVRAAAARNEQRFSVTLESSAVPFNILAPVRDAQGRCIDLRWDYVNPAGARTLGMRVEDLNGRRVSEVLPRNWETPGLLDRYIGVIDRGEQHEFEVQSVNRPDLWFHVIASPLHGAAAVWFADISKLKAQELELQEADRRKDEFLATLAHELRNPLAPIRQATRIARAAAATDAQKQWGHDVIERQVQGMALLLDDLLDVSRITRGTLLLRKSTVTLSSVVDAAVESARPHIDAKGHRLAIDVPERALMLDVDPLRLSQVIGNLLTNAAKYTDPGGRIALVARREGTQLLVRVSDNGVGLPAEQLGRLFEMFSQLPTATGRSQGGLGIGLALSRALVRLHGADIEARSAGLGLGSEFIVRLPASCLAPSVAAASRDDARQATPARGNTGLRILVADDNRDTAQSLQELLMLSGHQVQLAYDGEEALAAFKRDEPDVALLDIGMPRLSGLDVARAIRLLPAGQRAIMIAITGRGHARDRREALEAGFDHHATKPVDPAHIQDLIAVGRSGAAAHAS